MTIKNYNIFIPQFVDESNINSQSLNVKSLIKYNQSPFLNIHSIYYNNVSADLKNKNNAHLRKMWRWRFWQTSLFFDYLKDFNCIPAIVYLKKIYPGS